MAGSNMENSTSEVKEEIKIVQTDTNSVTGQNKCPKCGSTDISQNPTTLMLTCNFCHHEFAGEKIEALEDNIENLEGTVITSGAANIDVNADTIMTLKCSSCGAEVVIDTASGTSARCHWCRSFLSINQQIPNGAVPDVVLPFKITKEEAQASINTFVKKRSFFANPVFKKEFTTDNIMGVYFPYMIIDITGHAHLAGEGEETVNTYTVKNGDDEEIRYDADLYRITRDFDIFIDDLTIESNVDRLDKNNKEKTNNIINSIMPFDTENCVKFDSNYLRGYTSEKRDTNVDNLEPLVQVQVKDIIRFRANVTTTQYDRGINWKEETFDAKGMQWCAGYLPVWLYSYQQVKGSKKVLHYVAVNARTKETMGSVPIHVPKLVIVSGIIEFLSALLVIFINSDSYAKYILLSLGVIFYLSMYIRYRNSNARHKYERETSAKMSNLVKTDTYVTRRYNLSNSWMYGENNYDVNGKHFSKEQIDKLRLKK